MIKASPYLRYRLQPSFFIDTGSDSSLLPADKNVLKQKPNDFTLYVANDSLVLTYGDKRIKLNLNLRRNFSWNFCVAVIPDPIIGTDWLAHFHLVPFIIS